MILWRISNHHDLSGKGGTKAAARWNVVGPPVVYLSETPAGALLEVLVHTTADSAPPTFSLLKISGPEVSAFTIDPGELPPDWLSDEAITKPIGASWLDESSSALLRVPSVIAPETWNVLLNPLHSDAERFQIERVYEYPFNLRLKY